MSAPRRRTAIAWPDPTPQAQPNFPPPPAPAPQAVHAAPVVVPPLPDEPTAAAPQAPAPAPAAPAAPQAPAPLAATPATAPAAPQVPASPAAPVAMPRFVAPPAAAASAPAPAPAAAPVAEPSAPISLAGAEVPAVLMPASRFVAPQAPVAPLPPVAPQAQAAPVAPAPPAAPQPAAAAPAPAGPGSTAPPGFAGSRIIAAESAQLLALDPSFDDDEPFADLPAASASTATPAPAPQPSAAEFQVMAATTATATPMPQPAAPPREIAGSRLLGMLVGLIPRRTEAPGLQPGAEFTAQPSAHTAVTATEISTRSTAATAIRLAASVLLAAIALFVVAPALAGPLKGVPVLGAALDQLRAFTLYPDVYGLTWLTAVFAIASCFGIVVAHMEQQAHKQGMRRDPVRRLNIALGGLLALTFGSGLFTTVSSHGWAAGAASTGFFAALCLLVPLGRLPGARAMASQPERAWVLLFLLSIPALLLAPSIPTILLLLLAFTRVRTNWGSIAAGADEHAGGPVDGTNRLSALVITLAVLIAASLGMHAMQQTSAEVNELRQGDEVTRIPGTIPGPTIDELKR